MQDKELQLRVWWIRNVPNQPHYYPVTNIQEAIKELKHLADFDLKNPNIETNAGGLEVLQDDEWTEFEDDEGRDIDTIIREEVNNET